MTTLRNDMTLLGRCKYTVSIGINIVAFILSSALIHWVISYCYYQFCVGHTLTDALMSMFTTGSIGCQILFRGMRITHFEYMKYIMSLFNIL